MTNYNYDDLIEFFNLFINKKPNTNKNITNNKENSNFSTFNISQKNNLSKDKVVKIFASKNKKIL